MSADTDCGGNRYIEKVFEEIEIIEDVVFAVKERSDGALIDLAYDIYLPANDDRTDRPAIMLAHGGAYLELLDQKSPDIVKLAKEFSHRGYVVISVDYRQEPGLVSLFSTENMVKAVGRALIDIRDVTCHLMDTTINHGNPYGVDPENVIVGGVSAGAVSFLQAVFLDSLSWLPQQYQDWILEVEPNTQALLDDKYCGARVKGLVNISGAVLDTNWMKAYKADEYPALMHVHGGIDPIVPYGYAHPFGLTLLPKLMGSSLVHERAQLIGLRSELDTYPTQGHAPILGINWTALATAEPLDVIFNQRIMNATLNHMSEFIYSLIECDPNLATGLNEQKTASLNFYPNPSSDRFQVQLPENYSADRLTVLNNLGQIVYSADVPPGETSVEVRHDLETGLYTILLDTARGERLPVTGQLLVVR